VPDQDFVITGDRAALGVLRREHMAQTTVWFNDPEVRRGLAHRGPPNEDGELRWYERMTEAGAARLALDWAFTILGLRNVILESYEFNAGAVRAYERAGFQVIGRRRDAVLALGRRWDSILMDATAEGFASPALGRLRPG
jgi:hypothetical protein